MSFVPDYASTLTQHDRERYFKKVEECGIDPYTLSFDNLDDDKDEWPMVTDMDRIDYLVLRTNFATKDAMRNYKSLEAHNFLTSGLVFMPRVKVLPQGRVIVLGKVHHSQRHSMEPLKLWVLASKEGQIITAHCNCMAGRCESCSHVAALIFLLEYTAKAKEAETCTERLNEWLRPTMTSVSYKEVRDIAFTSASARLQRLEANVQGYMAETEQRPRRQSLPEMTSSQWNGCFLASLAEANPIAVGLSVHKDFCAPFKTPPSSPLDFTKLYNHNTLDLSYSELLEKCRVVMDGLKITEAERSNIEYKTRQQAHNILWHLYRLGRITGSMVFKVLQGNVNNPARTTWETICKGRSGSEDSNRRKSLNADIRRGRMYEEKARNEYEALQKKNHVNFKLTLSGLVIHPEFAFIASSPDARVSCDCCSSHGCLEIKCPREENLTKCLDSENHLLKEHEYYCQVQAHMLVTGAAYCDLYLWLARDDPKNPLKDPELKPVLVRVYRDEEKLNEIVAKSKDYFFYVILPEMIAHWFSRRCVPPLQPLVDNVVLPNICFCQSPRRDPMVICAGMHCTFKEFHCRCVDLSTVPRNKWYCAQCVQSAPKPKSRKRSMTVNDENLL